MHIYWIAYEEACWRWPTVVLFAGRRKRQMFEERSPACSLSGRKKCRRTGNHSNGLSKFSKSAFDESTAWKPIALHNRLILRIRYVGPTAALLNRQNAFQSFSDVIVFGEECRRHVPHCANRSLYHHDNKFPYIFPRYIFGTSEMHIRSLMNHVPIVQNSQNTDTFSYSIDIVPRYLRVECLSRPEKRSRRHSEQKNERDGSGWWRLARGCPDGGRRDRQSRRSGCASRSTQPTRVGPSPAAWVFYKGRW